MSALRERVRRLRLVSEPTPAWQLPPAQAVVRPDLAVAVAVSDRLAAGLADQWRQRPVMPGAVTVGGADLLLVELADGVVPGFGAPGEPEVTALLAAAARTEVPVVLWVTSGRPPSGRDHTAALTGLIEAAVAVYVADLLEAWQELVPQARLLPPAAVAHRPVRDPRSRRAAEARAVVVSAGSSDVTSAGPVATALGPALRPLGDQVEVLLLDHDLPARGVLPAPLAEQSRQARHAEVLASVIAASVVVDGPRRTPGDTWTLLESAAAGTPVVSLAGLLAPEGFPVVTPDGAQAVRAEVVARLHQPELADREALVQRRAVLARHTFGHRTPELLTSLGRPEPVHPEATVSAVVPTNRLHEVDNVLASIGRQAHSAVELVLVLHGVDLPEAELQARARDHGVPQLEVVRVPGHLTLGACLNRGVEASGGDLVAKMDDDNFYGTHYLTDLVRALDYSGADVVGKWAHLVHLEGSGETLLRFGHAEHRFVELVQGGTLLLRRALAEQLRFEDLPRSVDTTFLAKVRAAGLTIYAADRFNFVSVRRADPAGHTWTITDDEIRARSSQVLDVADPYALAEA